MGVDKIVGCPQSSKAVVLVILCNIWTVKVIVMELLWLLYMLATTAGGLATSKFWQTKNPHPYCGNQGKCCILLPP